MQPVPCFSVSVLKLKQKMLDKKSTIIVETYHNNNDLT